VHVWVSGAYLRLAKLLKTDNPQESQAYLNQAKTIIDSDSRLVIRKQQLEAFLKE
jgi:chaperonin cofactor prefoldin